MFRRRRDFDPRQRPRARATAVSAVPFGVVPVAPARPRRGIVLPVVLVLIGLLAVTMAGFVFFVRAETAGMIAHGDAQQARLAAESGLEEIVAMLREDQHNARQWFSRPDRFRHALVWAATYDRQDDPVAESRSRTEAFDDGEPRVLAWRYSAVAPDTSGLENTLRFGITPESGKLDINLATDAQIRQLFTPLLIGLQIENPDELINAFLDWRDADEEPRLGGAENEYYNTLEPPYSAKNGPLDTIEELLLVKGFSAAVLYGEDVNRNGYLDPNEDDTDETFPYYDNGDSVLDRGIAPFITVWPREPDTALDNKPRINLNADAGIIAAQIADAFQEEELTQATIDFIVALKQQNFDFSQVGSAAALYAGADLPESGDQEEGDAPASGLLADSPITLEELPYIMDRFSTVAIAQGGPQLLAGRININTAPYQVLVLVPGMTAEVAAAIIATRSTLEAEDLATTAWPMVAQIVDLATFQQIAPAITTKAYQFHIEVIGYADHVQLFRRYEWIIEMVGPLAQIKYRRDLTRLGFAWPLDDDTVIVNDS